MLKKLFSKVFYLQKPAYGDLYYGKLKMNRVFGFIRFLNVNNR